MGDMEVEFITRFHNLEGNSVNDRKKNFFKLLRDKSALPNEEQLEIVVKELRPKTYLESLLRIDMLIYFKKTSELLNILKEGNEVFISKIIKQPWFFEEAFREISADELVNDFLPCTPFTVRMKILKKLPLTLNEAQMDKLYECVLKRYGLHIAKNILHRCSFMKIIKVLSDEEIRLRPRQVVTLFDRDLGLFNSYCTHYQNITQRPYENKYVLKYIALRNPKFLLELNRKEKLSMALVGRRLSKKIVNLVKDDVKKNVTSYTTFLKPNVIVRKLQDDFRNVYLDLFPRRIVDIGSGNLCNELLKFYPKNRRWDLFAQTFSQVFENETIIDNLDNLYHLISNMCPDKEVKRRWAEVKYGEKGDESFLKYYEPAKVIPLIKEKMNVCSKMKDRLSLLKTMIDSCKEYQDLTALEKVLEFGYRRLRNAHQFEREEFLDHICHCFSLEDLSEGHWKFMNKLIYRASKKGGYNFFWYYSDFMAQNLLFLFRNCKPFDKELSHYIEEIRRTKGWFWPKVNNIAFEKEILTQITNILGKVNEESSNYKWIYEQLVLNILQFNCQNCIVGEHCIRLLDFTHLITFIKSIFDNFEFDDYEIIENIVRYNRQFPQNAIPVEEGRLQEIIFNLSISDEYYAYHPLLEFMLMRKNRSHFENEILKLYFDKIIEKRVNHKINFWFLKNEPEILIPYVKKILSITDLNVLRINRPCGIFNNGPYLKEIKLCSHLNVDVAFIDFLQKKLRDPDCESKDKIMTFLSILLSTDGFVKVVAENFLPSKIKLDLQDEEMKKVYSAQCGVANILNDVSEPAKMLPILMEFCIGDYLQSALRSLYSICYRSPENQLFSYIDILSKRAVSVQKHAVFLSCALLDYDYALNQLKNAKRNNISSKKHVFLATHKYFLRNHSEDLLDLLTSNVSMIDKNDKETLVALLSTRVPKKFQALFIEKCWRYLERTQDLKIDDYLNSLLLEIIVSTHVIVSLSSEFYKDFLSNYFEQRVVNLSNVDLYVCKVLRLRESEQKENFSFVFEVISNFKANNKLEHIDRFFNEFYLIASSKNGQSDFVNLFCIHWKRCFTPMEMFDEYVLLELLKMKYDSPDIEYYTGNVVTFMHQLILEYGLYVYAQFKSLLKRTLASDFVDEKDRYLFFYYLLKHNITTTNCILVIDIMNKVCEDEWNNSKEHRDIFKIYCDVLQILEKVKVPIVEVHFKSYLGEI